MAREERLINNKPRGEGRWRSRFERRQCRVAGAGELLRRPLVPVGWNPKQIAPKRGPVGYVLAVRNAKRGILNKMEYVRQRHERRDLSPVPA
jgi:hypothetical protein